MKRHNLLALSAAAAAGVALLSPTQAQEPAATTPAGYDVGVELCLLVDESGSVNKKEWELQRNGYVDAFRDREVQRLVAASGGVAVQYIVFAREHEQHGIGWQVLRDEADCEAFATRVSETTRQFKGATGMSNAIAVAMAEIRENDISSRRQVIDISGDGEDEGHEKKKGYGIGWEKVMEARPENLTINGISIGDGNNAVSFYKENLGVGPGGFVLHAEDFKEFGRGIRSKLIREISPHKNAISFD